MPNLIIDIECMSEMDINFNETGYTCQRCGDAKTGSEDSSQTANGLRERPFTMFRAVRPAYKGLKRKSGKKNNPLLFKDRNVSWLGNRWLKMNGGNYPSKRWVMQGIVNTDASEIRRLYP